MKLKKIETVDGAWRDNVLRLINEDEYDAVVVFEKGNVGCHIHTLSERIIMKLEGDVTFERCDLINGVRSFYNFADSDLVMGWMGERFLSATETIVLA